MANHRAAGRAQMRPLQVTNGAHRDSTVQSGAVKVGVLGVLATATIAAPLASAAAGDQIDVPVAAAPAPAATAAKAPAEAVAIPVAKTTAASEVRVQAGGATRAKERTAPAASTSSSAAKSGMKVSMPAPEPAADSTANDSDSSGSAVASGSGYMRPVGGPITSPYGMRIHPVLGYAKFHDGVDFGATCGTPVHAAQAGKVTAVEYNPSSGQRVKVDHGNGVTTGYYHLQSFNTSVGATVKKGDVVGYVGSTGRSTGCHLHFAAIDSSGQYTNPMNLLR